MPLADLDPAQLHRLLTSRAWLPYRDYVLEEYHKASQLLDTAREDHRYYQGVKHALQMLLTQPYVHAGLESPLVASVPRPRRPPRPTRDDAETVAPVPRIRRTSYLA